MEFRKLSVTQQFGSGLAGRLHSVAAAAPAGEAGRGRGGLADALRGSEGQVGVRSSPGLGALSPALQWFHLFGGATARAAAATCLVQPCALRRGTDPDATAVTAGRSGKPNERAGAGRGARDCSAEIASGGGGAGAGGWSVLLRTSISHPRKGEGRSAGQVLQLLGRMQAVAGQDGAAVPLSWPPGDPDPAEPRSRPAPCRSLRAPSGVAVAVRPLREPGHPRRGQWRPLGARSRAGRSPPLLPRPVPPPAPPPRAPQRCLYLPPPLPPSHRRYPWRLGTLPSSGPRGCLASLRVLAAAERALGLNPASLEEEEEEEQSGLARTASPYSPFNSLALSCSVGSRPSSLRPLAPLPPRLRGAAVAAAAAAATFSCNTPSLLSSSWSADITQRRCAPSLADWQFPVPSQK